MQVFNAKKEPVELEIGKWYVGVNYIGYIECSADGKLLKDNLVTYEYTEPEYGAIAQYCGDGEFYDEDALEPTRMQDYEYLLEQ